MAELSQIERSGVTYDLKDTTARAEVGKKLTSPTTAKVGQMMMVKAVDDTGAPTEWKMVDKPSGGATWFLLGDITLEEEASAFEFAPVDDEGNKIYFDAIRMTITAEMNVAGTTTSYDRLSIYADTADRNDVYGTRLLQTMSLICYNVTDRSIGIYAERIGDYWKTLSNFGGETVNIDLCALGSKKAAANRVRYYTTVGSATYGIGTHIIAYARRYDG